MGCGGSVLEKQTSAPAEATGVRTANSPGSPPPPQPQQAEDPNATPKVLADLCDSNGLLPRDDLELSLKVLGLVKGPLLKALKDVMVKPNGTVNVENWWFELRLEPRNRVIIGSKIKQPRPDGWELRAAMNVAKVFDKKADVGDATIARKPLCAALEEFGIESQDVEACVAHVQGASIGVLAWMEGLQPECRKAIVEELDGIVEIEDADLEGNISFKTSGGGGAPAVDPLSGAKDWSS